MKSILGGFGLLLLGVSACGLLLGASAPRTVDPEVAATVYSSFDPLVKSVTTSMQGDIPDQSCQSRTQRQWCRIQNRNFYWNTCPPKFCQNTGTPEAPIYNCVQPDTAPCSECSNMAEFFMWDCCWLWFEETSCHWNGATTTFVCGTLNTVMCPQVACPAGWGAGQVGLECPAVACPPKNPTPQTCSDFICKNCP